MTLEPTYGRARARAIRAASPVIGDRIARATKIIPTLVLFQDKTRCDVDRGRVSVTIAAVKSLDDDGGVGKRLDAYINARLQSLRDNQGEDA